MVEKQSKYFKFILSYASLHIKIQTCFSVSDKNKIYLAINTIYQSIVIKDHLFLPVVL